MVVLPTLRDASAYGFFFDFDGTLTELAETPGAVVVEDRVQRTLESLLEAAAGAVAIVTGREIDDIDAFFAPLRLPVAGVHGFERRNGGGTLSARAAEDSAARSVEKFCRALSTTILGFSWKGSEARSRFTTASGRNLKHCAFRLSKMLRTACRKPC